MFYIIHHSLNIKFLLHSCYKDYLSINFPFGSYKQVFIEPEMAVSSLCSGASMSIFSSQVLFDEKIIDQVGFSPYFYEFSSGLDEFHVSYI